MRRLGSVKGCISNDMKISGDSVIGTIGTHNKATSTRIKEIYTYTFITIYFIISFRTMQLV